jgi:hypothetical protein
MSAYATTAVCWITEHLQTDSRKFEQASVELAGLYIEVRHNAQRRTYAWFLNGRECTREQLERAIDQRLNG